MKKSIGASPSVFPMPVLMIATYNEDGSVDVMNMAWGGVCDMTMVALNLEADHKTVANLRARKAFTLSIADIPHISEADYFGMASGNDTPDKFARSGMTAVKSEKVDAPIVTEFPLTMECEVIEMQDQPYGLRVLGKVVDVLVDEDVLDANGKVDAGKLNAFVFDQFRSGYYAIGEQVGEAWSAGAKLMK